ncbi:MFS transporter [Nonomuraea glycinis]|uniref:MFS transporter n=1 Tax=Nonomuraea glycinis TaxID=2047744 RepID=A0A918E498_9ACTN|nr:MFS transporter [Nonomuraea glycinis]MCA2180241.1 MFS transporter [Nonomuraea glycinis]GGP03828.1 MFS transporter [Nonomuraea glycinis]
MTTNPTTNASRAGRREWAGLAVLALPTVLLALDLSVLHLAVPHLSAALAPSGTELLWILDVYGFMIAGFLVTMGWVGDRIGRRRLLMIGATAFGLASALAAYSTGPGMLIVSRALLGVAGATLMPSTLALLGTMFKDPRQRAMAVGVWMTSFMGGTAIGPLVGGLLLERFWWGSAFLIGVPVMALLLLAAPLLLPEQRDPQPGSIDLVSVALSLAALLPVVYGLKELAKDGPRPLALAALVAGALFGIWFVRRQRTLDVPLVDLRLFSERGFAAALAIMLLAVVTTGGGFLMVAQYLQLVAGLSALEAGVWLLPATLLTIAGSLLAPKLAGRMPMGHLIGAGLALAAVGYLLLALVDGSPATAVAGMAIAFLGVAPMMVLGTDLVMGSAPPEKAGAASALSETSGELGIALGVALLGSVGTAVYRALVTVPDGVPGEAAAAARDTLPAALATAADLPADAGAELLESAHAAFIAGLNVVGVVSAVIALGLAALARTAFRDRGTAPIEDGECLRR